MAKSSSGVASTVSSRPRSAATSAWTTTFDASSAEIRFQPVILPSFNTPDAGPARVQPAALVGALVVGQVGLAIDLEPVLVEAPLVHEAVAVAVDELAEQLTLTVADA